MAAIEKVTWTQVEPGVWRGHRGVETYEIYDHGSEQILETGRPGMPWPDQEKFEMGVANIKLMLDGWPEEAI